MTKYAICFDYDDGGDPWFAGRAANGTMGWAPSLATAELFDSEDAAERTLKNAYGPASQQCGTVVEVGQ